MSGVEVMRRAREAGFRGKFILLTGYAEFAYARAAIRCGATDYLLKPVDEEELLRAVHRAEAELLLDNVVELYGSQSTSQLRASLLEGVLRGHAVAAREIEAAGLCRRGSRSDFCSCPVSRSGRRPIKPRFATSCPLRARWRTGSAAWSSSCGDARRSQPGRAQRKPSSPWTRRPPCS